MSVSPLAAFLAAPLGETTTKDECGLAIVGGRPHGALFVAKPAPSMEELIKLQGSLREFMKIVQPVPPAIAEECMALLRAPTSVLNPRTFS